VTGRDARGPDLPPGVSTANTSGPTSRSSAKKDAATATRLLSSGPTCKRDDGAATFRCEVAIGARVLPLIGP
jgi:hypothetical protein